jgi:hypothetical protein
MTVYTKHPVDKEVYKVTHAIVGHKTKTLALAFCGVNKGAIIEHPTFLQKQIARTLRKAFK